MLAMPQMLPTNFELIEGALTLLVAFLTAGAGRLCGVRRLEAQFFAGWGLACGIFVLIGTLTPLDLKYAALLVAVLGLFGWVRRGRGAPLSLYVLGIGSPLLVMMLGMRAVGWDDLAFWAPNLLALCRTGHFPSLLHPDLFSQEPAYPYGLALSGFAVQALQGPLNPGAAVRLLTVGILWNVLAMLAAAAALANLFALRLAAAGRAVKDWGAAALAAAALMAVGYANPSFVPKITFSDMGDSPTGAGLAIILALIFELGLVPEGPARWRIGREICLVACALAFIRQENLALLGLLAMGYAGHRLLFTPHRSLTGLGLVSAPPLALAMLWSHYTHAQIPGGAHELLPVAQWHWPEFGGTLASAWRVLLAKGQYTALALVFAGLLLAELWRMARASAPLLAHGEASSRRESLLVINVLVFGNIAFLLFCYLATSFNAYEARTAITFWRFLGQTGQAEMVALACLIPPAWLVRRPARPRALAGFSLAVLAWPLVLGMTRFTYRYDLIGPVPRLQQMALQTETLLPPGGRLHLVDMSGNGFVPLVFAFSLRNLAGDDRPLDIHAAPWGLSPAAVHLPLVPGDAYLLAEGAPDMPAMFGQTTQAGCTYLFAATPHGAALVKAWAIGPYRWETQIYDETVRGGGSCPQA